MNWTVWRLACPPLLACCFLLSACAHSGGMARDAASRGRARAEALAREAGFDAVRFETATFVLLGRLRGRGEVLTVYIEGDGHAWRRRDQPASDPTPADPLTLRLAAADLAPAVLHLARPCQYVEGEDRRHCGVEVWTGARHGEAVVTAMSQAIDQAKELAGAAGVELVGYSGGAAVAALLAQDRADVLRLVTVAGNLNPAAWTRHHNVTPLAGSRDPLAQAHRLRLLPQTHFVGEHDEVTPPFLARSFVSAQGDCPRCAVVVAPAFDHRCCWETGWRDRMQAVRRATLPPEGAP